MVQQRERGKQRERIHVPLAPHLDDTAVRFARLPQVANHSFHVAVIVVVIL